MAQDFRLQNNEGLLDTSFAGSRVYERGAGEVSTKESVPLWADDEHINATEGVAKVSYVKRIGNFVTFVAKFDDVAVAGSGARQIKLMLPIPRVLVGVFVNRGKSSPAGSGIAVKPSGERNVIVVDADTTQDELYCYWESSGAGVESVTIECTYGLEIQPFA